MASDGSITFSTKLDNRQLERDLKDTARKVDALKAKVEEEQTSNNAIKEKLDDAAASASHFQKRLEELQTQYDGLKESFADASDPMQKESIAEQMRQNLASQQAVYGLLGESRAELSAIEQKWQDSNEKLAKYNAQLQSAKSYQEGLAAQLSKMYKAKDGNYYTSRMSYAFARIREAGTKAASVIRNAHADAARTMQKGYTTAAQGMRGILKGVVPIVTLTAGFHLLFSKMKEFLLQNEQVKASMNGLKAACNGFASGLATIAAPALLGFARVATTMLMTLARLIDSLFKTDFAGHIAAQVQAASASVGSAGSAKKQAKATDRLAKSLKEANRQLMSFDELNVLNADQSDEDADALDDLADDLDAGGGFDPATLLDGIDETLAKIMLLAGAALLAIGIVLAFSGANVPLGLALMAIGALMIYTAYKEQWDKLPAEVQDAMSLILAIIGAALIVVGVVLCFLGHPALGVAFIIAGAAMFAVDAMINPEYMAGLVEQVKEHILGIIAGALIVVGILLCVTGHPLLGIAFIIAGAAIFVMEAVLEYDKMPNEVRNFIVSMLAVVGAALIVIGVLLCATGHPILGIAAILVGVLAFVAAAALDDQESPNRIRKFLTEMLPIIGKALIVVGVLLCVVGNLPLGIAAIIFGIVIWVTGEALVEGVPAEKIMGFIKEMLPAIGQALVVIGVLLCVMGQLPLGIAAIIFGVTIWVVGEVLNENLTKEKIESLIENVLPVIYGAMIVIGIILCVTGVALPIGIGLIVAGIGLLVFSQMDLDWDFILNKIKEVWGGICRWWDQNVAHIFTLEFWEGIFKSIADGIWSAITSVGDTISGFFNGIGEGIGGLLSGLGQGFSWVVPSFDFAPPMLATGAVIPPNRRFMAVLGDQSNGNNLEGPESLFRQIVREESGAGGGVEDVLYQILEAVRDGKVIQVDGDVLGRTGAAYQASMQRVNGW